MCSLKQPCHICHDKNTVTYVAYFSPTFKKNIFSRRVKYGQHRPSPGYPVVICV